MVYGYITHLEAELHPQVTYGCQAETLPILATLRQTQRHNIREVAFLQKYWDLMYNVFECFWWLTAWHQNRQMDMDMGRKMSKVGTSKTWLLRVATNDPWISGS